MQKDAPPSLILLFILIRTVVNTSYRMIYPFLSMMAAGMGVSIQAASLSLTGRSLVGVLGPLLAPVADRYGRKTGMILGLSLFCLGTGLVAAWPSFPAFVAALILAHVGNQVFLPAMQAYLGDRIPFQTRGRYLALTELSWSFSFILMVPLAGFLIARAGWAAPFWLLFLLGVLALVILVLRVPSDRAQAVANQAARPAAMWQALRQVATSPAAQTVLGFNLLITSANEVVNLVFGVWMKDTFEVQIAALGLAATVIGLAELSGESATAILVDRIGKKRAVSIGVIFTSLAALALPVLGQSLPGALAGLFLFYLGFEFTLVSYIPLMTEVMPQTRATLIAVNMAASSLGRAVGAFAGVWLYTFGFGANAVVALLLNAAALFVLRRIKIAGDS